MSTEDSATILVVEDEEDLAQLYAQWLRSEYRVRVAYRGEQAIESFDKNVDIVLLDRRMPGISGDEVLEMILDEGYTCRVAMVTAVEPDFDIIDMGFDDYLVKPVSSQDLHATVRRLVKRSTYDTRLKRYASLVSKKSALEAEKPPSELDSNERYHELTREIEDLRSSVDGIVEEFDTDDVAAVLRDITPPPETP